jgi:ubiquinone/menaquinone biosynthesis C-methylase UbiE
VSFQMANSLRPGRGSVNNSKEGVDAGIPQNEVAGLYDRLAKVYDAWAALTESRARMRAVELAEIRDGQTILEVAAGTGLVFFEIVRRNPRGLSVGIDLSRNMLLKAKERLTALSGNECILVRGTASTLPVKDESVDVLMNSYMFDLVPFGDMAAILKEFRRVLKDGGQIVLVTSTIGKNWVSRLSDLISRSFPKLVGGCRSVRMSDRLLNAGFTILRREYHQQMLLSSEVIVVKHVSRTPVRHAIRSCNMRAPEPRRCRE